ncbi:unnamed protein product [Blumeria hordei]|uniref:CN hydrolase domain-containing protein n=1 Tax=Blumeria hordei TaxID=2867405 RepID=A0A383UTN1_BLUHO|nr:unnamed protein product [Blumeria hordei]
MKVIHIQFAAIQGDVAGSISKVEGLLHDVQPGDVDFLLLPELAFAGYNFSSLSAIQPYLELSESGPSSVWARTTAQRLQSIVSVGYAEKVHATSTSACTTNYNSNITYGPDGRVIAHYRKCFLYMTDESWCAEGGEGFYAGKLPAPVNQNIALGICMDINPYRFTAPWTDMEFAHHALEVGAQLVVVSMAWNSLTLSHEDVLQNPSNMEPDLETLDYWIQRFKPLVEANNSVLLVMGNRCGVEEQVVYAGTSMIARVGRGSVEIWDVAGRGEERLLVVDTDTEPQFNLRFEPRKFTASA